MKRTEIIDAMNDLVEVAKDGVYGFRTCATHASADELRQLLEQRARGWETHIGALNEMIVEHRGTPVAHGSAAGAMHRGWLRVREALSTVNDEDLLAECERGEDQALRRYRRSATLAELPDRVVELINLQADTIERHRDELRRRRAKLHAMV